MKRIWIILCLLLCLWTCASAEWATVRNQQMGDRLNLREHPSKSAVSLGKYYTGTRVQILEEDPATGWCQVRIGLGDGIGEAEGYMQTLYLAFDVFHENVVDERPRVTLGSPGETVMLKSAPAGSNVGFVPGGTLVTVLGVGTHFLHVLCAEGTKEFTGFVPLEKTNPRLSFGSTAAVYEAPEETGTGQTFLYVINGPLNFRSSPDPKAEVLCQYYAGTAMQVLSPDTGSGWTQVRAGMGTGIGELQGYVMTRYLGTEKQSDRRPHRILSAEGKDRVILKNFEDGSTVGTVPNGTEAVVLGESAALLHVAVGNQTGFVRKGYAHALGKAVMYVHNPDGRDRLQLRTGPGKGYPAVAKFLNGTPVTVILDTAGEQYVRVRAAGLEGYVDRGFLRHVRASDVSTKAKVTADPSAPASLLVLDENGEFIPGNQFVLGDGTEVQVHGLTKEGMMLVSTGDLYLWVWHAYLSGQLPKWNR